MPFFDIFASPRWSPLRMRTKVVSFFIFQLSNKKIKALRPKMTKIASRGSCLKTLSLFHGIRMSFWWKYYQHAGSVSVVKNAIPHKNKVLVDFFEHSNFERSWLSQLEPNFVNVFFEKSEAFPKKKKKKKQFWKNFEKTVLAWSPLSRVLLLPILRSFSPYLASFSSLFCNLLPLSWVLLLPILRSSSPSLAFFFPYLAFFFSLSCVLLVPILRSSSPHLAFFFSLSCVLLPLSCVLLLPVLRFFFSLSCVLLPLVLRSSSPCPAFFFSLSCVFSSPYLAFSFSLHPFAPMLGTCACLCVHVLLRNLSENSDILMSIDLLRHTSEPIQQPPDQSTWISRRVWSRKGWEGYVVCCMTS